MYYLPRADDYFINRLVASATAKTEIVYTGEERSIHFLHVEMSFLCDDHENTLTMIKPWGFPWCKRDLYISDSSRGVVSTLRSASTSMLPFTSKCTKLVCFWRSKTSNLTVSKCTQLCSCRLTSCDSEHESNMEHSARRSSRMCGNSFASEALFLLHPLPASLRPICCTCSLEHAVPVLHASKTIRRVCWLSDARGKASVKPHKKSRQYEFWQLSSPTLQSVACTYINSARTLHHSPSL